MNTQPNKPTNDDQETNFELPSNPLFRSPSGHASFGECIEAIGHVNEVIELFDFLELDDSRGGLSLNASNGFYWINLMMRGALSYISERLTVLNKQVAEDHWQESICLSALATSLETLGRENHERFLNGVAAQMKISRPELDNFVREKAS